MTQTQLEHVIKHNLADASLSSRFVFILQVQVVPSLSLLVPSRVDVQAPSQQLPSSHARPLLLPSGVTYVQMSLTI